MKNILKTLDGCLPIVNASLTYGNKYCHISLTDGNHTIYISPSKLCAGENICAATPDLPVNETKFTTIALVGISGFRNSTQISPSAKPHN